jgi:1-deoxy-D-xylulose-5-phosphate reductoisomerase
MIEKNISILGSTGSVGRNSLEVIRKFKSFFKVKSLSACQNIDLLEEQAREFSPELIAVYDERRAEELRSKLPYVKIVSGSDGLIEAAQIESADFVIAAISGSIGLIPTIAAIEKGKTIGLANKEVLVSGGEYVTSLVKKKGSKLIPIDSEHSAIFQCLKGEERESIKRLILTASGGPFREYNMSQLDRIGVEEALLHPTYRMGSKISIDSSTLMNKGLEVIEAYYLFSVPLEKIEVVIHPQSIIHSFVEFIDGSILAQMGEPDMKVPIQYALTYPWRKNGEKKKFDFIKNAKLEFFPPDLKKFRSLYLAYEALRLGGSMPCYMNGVNEILVERFLKKEISWKDIAIKLEKLMSSHKIQNMINLEAILEVDKKAKIDAKTI